MCVTFQTGSGERGGEMSLTPRCSLGEEYAVSPVLLFTSSESAVSGWEPEKKG